jgi:hypothetical protein
MQRLPIALTIEFLMTILGMGWTWRASRLSRAHHVFGSGSVIEQAFISSPARKQQAMIVVAIVESKYICCSIVFKFVQRST